MSNWIPVNNIPKDGTKIQRWHKIYKCPVTVYYKSGFSTVEGCNWITGTVDHSWPEEAFEPFWQPLPTAPSTPPDTATIPLSNLHHWQQQLSHIVSPYASEVWKEIEGYVSK